MVANHDSGCTDAEVLAVLNARSPRALKVATAALTTSRAPGDLVAALSRNYKPVTHRIAETFGGLAGQSSDQRKALRWLRTSLEELRHWDDAPRWTATELAPNVTRFSNPSVPNEDKTLMVGFAGNSNQLMVPSYQILRAIGSDRGDLILVRDPSMRFFEQGVAGLGDTPEAVASFIGAVVEDGRYQSTLALATSAGGLFGIYTALLHGWERVVAVGPDDPPSYPVLEELLSTLSEYSGSERATQIRVCYTAKNDRNRKAAEAISTLLPRARLFPFAGPEQHNLLESIAEAGDLDSYLQHHCFDGPEAKNSL